MLACLTGGVGDEGGWCLLSTLATLGRGEVLWGWLRWMDGWMDGCVWAIAILGGCMRGFGESEMNIFEQVAVSSYCSGG